MAEQDHNKPSGGDASPSEPPFNPEVPPAEAPALSPAAQAAPAIEPKPEPAAPAVPDMAPRAELAAAAAAAPEPKVEPAAPAPRQNRRALLAASIVLAAGIGGVLGGYTTASWIAPPPQPDVAGIAERKALQQSIAQLSRQVAALKTDLDKSNKLALDKFNKITADLASKPASSPVTKTADRADIGRSAEITGTIPAPAAAAPPAAPGTVAVPMPAPRPAAPRVAAVTNRPTVLQDWWIYDARGGYIFVAGHGEIYQAVPGAPLPGLGPVQSIKRENGAWMVVTPRGIIVADRDRALFQ